MLLLAAPLWLGALVAWGGADEIDRRLADLADPRVQVRHGAERWLSANVEPSDVGRLAAIIRQGDAEVRLRIARIVAQADTDLTMTAALVNAGDARLAAVGEQVLGERINRWSPRMAARGETDLGVVQILAELAEDHGPRALRVSLEQPLEEVCALLARRGALPIGITVEAEVRARDLRRPDEAVVEAGWSELVPRLAEAYGVGLDLFGFERTDAGERQGGFLRFTSRTEAGRRPGLETGEEVLVRWFRQSTSASQEANRSAAARNLASSGWPDALAWLEARYRTGRDPAALAGLLAAASTGRVAPLFFESDVVRVLVRAAGADLDSGEAGRRARAHATLDALSELGCLGRRGEDLASVVLEGFDEASPRARWVRLALLEGLRCPTAAAALDALVLDVSLAPALRLQALRAWSAATSAATDPAPARPLPGVEALLGSVDTASAGVELARLLASGAFQPPAAWEDPERLPADWGFGPRTAVFGWVGGRGEVDRAARLGLGLLARAPGEDAQARGEAVAHVLSLWVERGEWVRMGEIWNGVRDAATDDRLRLEVERVALLARLVPPEDGIGVFRALQDRPLPAGPDLAVLAVAAAWGPSSEGEFARQRLNVLFQEALSQNRPPAQAAELIEAFETALGELQRLGLDSVALEWRRPTIQGLIRRYRKEADLARGLPGDWPSYPVRKPVDPARRDRRLPSGLP